jgi:hypothetical protein
MERCNRAQMLYIFRKNMKKPAKISLLANIGFDTVEKEPPKLKILIIS